MDHVGMDLAQGYQRPKRTAGMARAARFTRNRSDFVEKQGAVALDGRQRILFGETEVEIGLAVGPRESAGAGGEAMHEPGERAQMPGVEDVYFCLLADSLSGSLGRHSSMLQEGAA